MPTCNDVTVSIVSHGHAAMLEPLLRGIERCVATGPLNVILTFNLADEPFDPGAFAGLDLRIVRNAVPQGFGANHNAAFRLCRTPWFAVLNPDIRLLDADLFARLQAAAASEANVAVVAPAIFNSTGEAEDAVRTNLTPASLFGRRLRGRRHAMRPRDVIRRGRPFRWLAGMFLLFDSAAYRAVGGFDERYFLYCEDYDLCARLYLAGYGLLSVQDAAVVHDAQRDSHRSARHLRWHLGALWKVWTSSAFWKVTLPTPGRRT